MRPNKLRAKLKAGEPTVSTHIHSTWPSVVEALGLTGIYDYVEFVAEYGSFDLHDLDNICRAAELHSMEVMIKVDQSHQAFLAQRGIGAGFHRGSVHRCALSRRRSRVRAYRPPRHARGWRAVRSRHAP